MMRGFGMDNNYIEFYGKNRISPVNQDISDIEKHYRRRQKLYRMCGIPTFAFKGSEMLEIGPGGGHNALAPIHWGIGHIDMVEANPYGVEKIRSLYSEKEIPEDVYTVFNMKVEEFTPQKQYDLVVAEGFLGYVPNAREICLKLQDFTKTGGVVVITCSDDTCIFIELMKRLVGIYVTRDIEGLENKVNALIPVFKPQLEKLRGVSRPAKDWIEDNIFNPAFSNGCEFSVGDALEVFSDFDLLGSSPHIFTNYSWYKDIWYDELKSYKEQFWQKRMSFIMAGSEEEKLDGELSRRLVKLFSDAKKLENEYEISFDEKVIKSLLELLRSSVEDVKCLGDRFVKIYDQIISVLTSLTQGRQPDMENYPEFFGAFGRGLQYMSFMKR